VAVGYLAAELVLGEKLDGLRPEAAGDVGGHGVKCGRMDSAQVIS
jgi:hypothetical protein